MEPSNEAALRGFPAPPPKRVAVPGLQGQLCSVQEGRWSVVRGRLIWDPVLLHPAMTQCLVLITRSNFQCSFDLIEI